MRQLRWQPCGVRDRHHVLLLLLRVMMPFNLRSRVLELGCVVVGDAAAIKLQVADARHQARKGILALPGPMHAATNCTKRLLQRGRAGRRGVGPWRKARPALRPPVFPTVHPRQWTGVPRRPTYCACTMLAQPSLLHSVLLCQRTSLSALW